MKQNLRVHNTFLQLLKYIVRYRRLRGRAYMGLVVEQLVLAYAKQLVSGMPEKHWRQNMRLLINECEEVHDKQIKQWEERQLAFDRRLAGKRRQRPVDVVKATSRRTFPTNSKQAKAIHDVVQKTL